MKRDDFIIKYKNASSNIDHDLIKRVINDSIECNPIECGQRGHRNLIIVMEELAELSQQISKRLRDKYDRISLLEETADVILCLEYIKNIMDFTDIEINKAINVKINRLRDVIKAKGFYK